MAVTSKELLAICIVMALQIADVATTAYALRHGASEANPLVAFGIKSQGEAFTYTAKLAVMLLLLLWLHRRKDSFAMVAGMSALPVVNNLFAIARV